MPKRSSIHRDPQDESRLAKSIIDVLTADEDEDEPKPEKNPAAVALGRLGGKRAERHALKSSHKKSGKRLPKRRLSHDGTAPVTSAILQS